MLEEDNITEALYQTTVAGTEHKPADFQISQAFSLSLIDEHGFSDSQAVAGYTSCLNSMTKRELNWTGAETHPEGTGSPA